MSVVQPGTDRRRPGAPADPTASRSGPSPQQQEDNTAIKALGEHQQMDNSPWSVRVNKQQMDNSPLSERVSAQQTDNSPTDRLNG